MMIRISDIKLPVEAGTDALVAKASKLLRISEEEIDRIQILRRSLDARKKPNLYYVYSIGVIPKSIKAFHPSGKHNNIMLIQEPSYEFPHSGTRSLSERPVVIGSGPAGLFCAYLLARHGYRPILLERGDSADIRTKKVEAFWNGQTLDPECNVQFGEGGAGTFSDGKLNTSVKDPSNRGNFILNTFVSHGAPSEIIYDPKPHLGTDLLTGILLSMRREIESLGGTYRFRSTVTDLITEHGKLKALEINYREIMKTDVAVLCPGHSARDTFEMLSHRNILMQPKAFAVGIRIEHPQKLIDLNQYGRLSGSLGAASYKLTHTTSGGRGVYTFCMCPGGYVVNASSEAGGLAVNGMSYQKRDSANANSAVVVTVTPKECASYTGSNGNDLIPGLAFQRQLEYLAFQTTKGDIPIQLFADFREHTISTSFGCYQPCIKGHYAFGRLDTCFPADIRDCITEGITSFGQHIAGFDRPDAILSGVESRTSSPLRILRDDTMETAISGLYPAGEGAGYAGGIMSAAMDGMKAAEAIADIYHSLSE